MPSNAVGSKHFDEYIYLFAYYNMPSNAVGSKLKPMRPDKQTHYNMPSNAVGSKLSVIVSTKILIITCLLMR